MASSYSTATGLLLLVLLVAVPLATAQGRSKIRIVECINESIGNMSLNMDALRVIVTTPTTTTPKPPTTTNGVTTENNTATEESGAIFGRLQFQDQEPGEGSWLMLEAVNLAIPELFQNEILPCNNNTNCEKVVFALDEADTITAEVNEDTIYEAQVDRIYKAVADVVKVVSEAPKDLELLEILSDNLANLDSRIEMLKADKEDMQDLQDKMRTGEKLAIVFGLIAGLLAFVGLTAAGYKCYQKTRKDEGVPEGQIME